jgi:O-antigen ligase
MTEIPAQGAMGWDKRRRSSRDQTRTRLRDVLPAIAAALIVTLANLAFGAVQPIAALSLSAVITLIAVAALMFAGPRAVTAGMVIGAAVLGLAAWSGLAGPLDRASAPFAVLFAAGGMWAIGYLAAGRRSALDAAWSTLIWTSVAYCSWMFISSASADAGRMRRLINDAFETPANAAVLFGLLAILGLARVLHVLKQVDADALFGLRMLERLLRDALGGFLLLGLSLYCLMLVGSRPGILMTLGVLLGHVWWDTLSIMTRPHRGGVARVAVIITPLLACALAILGVTDGWLHDETIAPGIGLSETLPTMQRFDAYSSLWLQDPITGHGLGSLGVEGATVQTLDNAKAMLAPGGAHNVFLTWLVETGLVGLALLLLALGAAHLSIVATLTSRRAPRTFVRLAFAASGLLMLHGVTDSSLNVPSVTWLYALLLGVACGLAGVQKDKDRTQAETGQTDAD